jgi:Lar family restriction alleviation protein
MSDPIPSELAPCPFCGSDELESASCDARQWVVCRDCGADGPVASNDAEMASLWNERLTSAPVGEDGEDISAEIRISIWNVAKDRGMSQDAAIDLVAKAMDEPAMKRALERLSTAPSPSPVARVPDREEIARALHDIFENDDDSEGGAYLRAADAVSVLFTASPSDGSGEGK